MNKTDKTKNLFIDSMFDRDINNPKKGVTIPDPPPWRRKDSTTQGKQYNPYIPLSSEEIKIVNAALILRRPILITGKPGSGKSSLAEAVRKKLTLGDKVLHWRITTQSKFTDGLYSYDALSRLQDIQFGDKDKDGNIIHEKINKYLSLEALGEAFTSIEQRVVLIDEIDKSQVDLPNNLLHLFEENEFEIPELKRIGGEFYHNDNKVKYNVVNDGLVKCKIDTFPLIIMTSNGERDFPPAFLRRCLHLNMGLPDAEQLSDIVTKHFEAIEEKVNAKDLADIIELFLDKRDKDEHNYLSTDQLLNFVYLRHKENIDIKDEEIQNGILRNLFG